MKRNWTWRSEDCKAEKEEEAAMHPSQMGAARTQPSRNNFPREEQTWTESSFCFSGACLERHVECRVSRRQSPRYTYPKGMQQQKKRHKRMTTGRENQRAVDVDRQYQGVAMKGSRPVLFLIPLCLQGMALEKAAEVRSFHPEMEMKVEVARKIHAAADTGQEKGVLGFGREGGAENAPLHPQPQTSFRFGGGSYPSPPPQTANPLEVWEG